MTDELIEQVARVVGQKIEGSAEDMDSLWYGQPLWKAYIKEARAVLPIIEAARTQGWNEAIKAAATIADHHREARRAAHNEAHRRGAKRQATSALGRSLEAQQLMVAIRALTKENSDASSD